MNHKTLVLLVSVCLIAACSDDGLRPPGYPVIASPNDSLLLVEIYNSTDGENWDSNSGWLTDRPLSQWDGVNIAELDSTTQISDDGYAYFQVEELVLYIQKMTGKLPDLSFSRLKRLDMHKNNLHGKLPNLELPKVEYISFDKNCFKGEIPDYDLPELLDVSFSSNKFTSMAPKSSLQALKILDISSNKLSFAALEEHMWIREKLGSNFQYSPQDTVYPVTQSPRNDGVLLRVDVKGTDIRYSWSKDGTIVVNSPDPEYVARQNGTYRCAVQSPLVPNLVIRSEKVEIIME